MYIASLLWLLAAVVALALGVRGSNLLFVYGSIAASVLSMMFLAADASRRRASEPLPGPLRSDWARRPVGSGAPVAHDVPEASPEGTEDSSFQEDPSATP